MIKPSPSAVFTAIKTMKPHVPLIKFRKSSGNHAGSAPSSPAVATAPQRVVQSATPSPARGKPNATIPLPIIEDWELPQRYRRRPIDITEIEYINRGGRDQ